MLKIRHKLFLMMITATGGVVLSMFLVMQWSFDNGFLRYLNQQQATQLRLLAKNVASYWKPETQWSSLRQQPRLWHEALRQSLSDGAEPPPPPPDDSVPEYFGPRDAMSGRPKPQGLQFESPSLLNSDKQVVLGPPRPNRFDRNRRNRNLGDQNRLGPGFSEHRPSERRSFEISPPVHRPPEPRLLEMVESSRSLIPIYAEESLIGYIAYHPRQRVSSGLNLAFADQQKKSFLIIAILMIVIVTLLSIPAARLLVKPIQRMITGTRKLTSGNFDARIDVTSRDELGELSTHFNTLAKTLEDNEGARKRWVADISHELRTPLSVLKGEIEAMQDGVRPMTHEALQSLQAEVQQLSHMVNDLYELSMSDIGALNYKMQPLELNQLLKDSVASFSIQAAQAGLSISLHSASEKKLSLFGDEARLKQLFNNLFTNTLRYTDMPGKLSIKLSASSQKIQLSWEDSSPSVERSQLLKLFERLYRVEASRSRAEGGAGLGLSICKNIVNAHNGEIQASESLLGGLCISIHLPIYSK